MPVGNYCHIGTVSYRVEKQLESFSLVCGWDSSTGWQTELGIGSDGGTYTIPWKKASPTVYEGELTGMLDGKKTTAKVRVEKTGKDEFRIAVTDQTEGDESRPDFIYTARRVVRETRRKPESSSRRGMA
jgi:hypothetical protein